MLVPPTPPLKRGRNCRLAGVPGSLEKGASARLLGQDGNACRPSPTHGPAGLQCLCSRQEHQGNAGAVIGTSTSVMAKGPTGFTTVRIGAMAISAGAILSPCSSRLPVRARSEVFGAVRAGQAAMPAVRCGNNAMYHASHSVDALSVLDRVPGFDEHAAAFHDLSAFQICQARKMAARHRLAQGVVAYSQHETPHLSSHCSVVWANDDQRGRNVSALQGGTHQTLNPPSPAAPRYRLCVASHAAFVCGQWRSLQAAGLP